MTGPAPRRRIGQSRQNRADPRVLAVSRSCRLGVVREPRWCEHGPALTCDRKGLERREHETEFGRIRRRPSGRGRGPDGPVPFAMIVYLVRHATAGSRGEWDGDDALRPLSPKGRLQADALADRFAPLGIERLLSSPAIRCRQSLEPLADRITATVEEARELAEGAPPAPALALITALAVDTALCAHGDLIPWLVEHLAAEGMRVEDPQHCQKAGTWTLERDNGRFVVGHYTPPP